MEPRYCRTCKKEIQDPTRKNYCSIECNPNYRGIRGVSVVCKHCGNEFYRKTMPQMFCSEQCRKTYAKEHPKVGEHAGHWQGGNVDVICANCGKEFSVKPYIVNTRKNIFCSRSCLGEWTSKNRLGEKASNWRGGKVHKVCIICGKEFSITKWAHEHGGGKCCSNECRYKLKSLQMCGNGNPMYEDGTSHQPYCDKFNKEFKRRVREFFGDKCILCGKTVAENNNTVMSVHHIYKNKMACCDGSDARFATLCRSCHSTISNYERYNPEKAEEYIHEINKLLDEKYNGKCFYTKEEYYGNAAKQ